MIPDNPNLYTVDEDNKTVVAPFIFPDNRSNETRLIDYERGGVAIQDTSKGLDYQSWTGYWDALTTGVYLVAETEAPTVPVLLFSEADVEEFSFTFDSNMRWSTVTLSSTGTAKHRWYDSAAAAYVISTYPGVASPRLALDDKRDFQVKLGRPDIILTYIANSQVRWRIQRDRFLVEYSHPNYTVPANYRISNFGMSTKRRLQWRFAPGHLGG